MPEEYISVEFTSHEQYLQILKKLESETAYIEIVQINGEDEQEELLVKAFKYMELAEKRYVKKWLGTVRSGKGAPQYLFKADKRFFKVLREFPSFFFNSKDKWGCDEVVETSFGQDDIAFLDTHKKALFFTTTHEGYADIISSLAK